MANQAKANRRIRYVVVGAGNLAQTAVLPAFKNAHDNSELVGIVSGDPHKREQLAHLYKLQHTGGYEQLEQVLEQSRADAVYIATPNSQHREQTIRAARCGVHILCEKPMAVTASECEDMIEAAHAHRVLLMVGYRLHFDEATLRAIELVKSGALGMCKMFSSLFSHQVRPGDIRTSYRLGGGALLDLGVYPINAARNLFRDEPVEVFAFSPPASDPAQAQVDETSSVLLRFPGERVAQLTVSQGATSLSSYRVVGTRGELRVEPAFAYDGPFTHYLCIDGKSSHTSFQKGDQFGPELSYFSRCILEGKQPEPSGEEGLLDVRVVNAAEESIRTGRAVSLMPWLRDRRPDLKQAAHMPVLKEPRPIRAPSPSL